MPLTRVTRFCSPFVKGNPTWLSATGGFLSGYFLPLHLLRLWSLLPNSVDSPLLLPSVPSSPFMGARQTPSARPIKSSIETFPLTGDAAAARKNEQRNQRLLHSQLLYYRGPMTAFLRSLRLLHQPLSPHILSLFHPISAARGCNLI
jgi:hypothetical protein